MYPYINDIQQKGRNYYLHLKVVDLSLIRAPIKTIFDKKKLCSLLS